MPEEADACPGEDQILGFHAGLLDGRDERRVADHLATCADCRAEVDELASDVRFADDVRDLFLREPTPDSCVEREALEALLRDSSGGQRYTVLGELGRGGMGVVYDVRDRVLQRNLAMKVLRAGQDGRPGQAASAGRRLTRFVEEARITGQLDHPSIIPVHELGLDAECHPYFTMSKVRGRNLHEVFEEYERGEGDWTLQGIVTSVLRGCDAVAYAHSKRVVHRDLKPSNIMVGRFGAVYVMDWGVATLVSEDAGHVDSTDAYTTQTAMWSLRDQPEDEDGPASPVLTLAGEVIGTPAYMAPEQALRIGEPVDLRADVYAMGAILYRLLSGLRPYDEASGQVSAREAWLRQIHGPPAPLAEVAPDAPPELVSICERAMERDPAHRYADMAGLAADLRAWLEGRVVRAHRVGALAEVRKWIRRNRALSGSALLALLATALVLGLLARQSRVEARGREAAARAAKVERLIDRDPAEALILAIAGAEELEDHLSRSTLLATLGPQTLDAALYSPAGRFGRPWFAEGIHRAWSPRGDLFLFRELDADREHLTIQVWDVAARRFTEDSFRVRASECHLAFDAQGRRIAAGSVDGSVSIHDRATGESLVLGDGRAHAKTVARVAFDPRGNLLASASWDGTVGLWDAETGGLVHRLIGHDGPVTSVEFDAQGARLLSAAGPSDGTWTTDHTVRLWDVVSGDCLLVFEGHDDFVTSARFDPSGVRVLSTSYDRTAKLWSADDGAVRHTLSVPGVCWAGAFSPEGTALAVAFDAGFLVRDVESGREERVGPYDAHDGRAVTDVVFSPLGDRLLTVGHDVVGRVWELGPDGPPRLARELRGIPTGSFFGSWSPDGSRIALSETDGARLWFARENRTIGWARPSEQPAIRVRVHPDGDRVLLAFDGDAAYEVGFTPGKGLHSARALGTTSPADVSTTADGDWLLVAETLGAVRLWHAGGEGPSREAGSVEIRAASLHASPAGDAVGAILIDGGAAVFDPSRPAAISRLAEGEGVVALAFSADGRRVALGTEEGVLRVVGLADERELWSVELPPASSHNRAIRAVAFDDVGGHLLSAGPELGVRVWDLESGVQVGGLRSATIAELRVLRDPTRLLMRDFWSFGVSLAALEDERPSTILCPDGQPLAHRNRITAWSVDRAGERLLTTSLDHTATLWDLERGVAWATFSGHDAPVLAGDLSRDGRWAVTADADGNVYAWPTDPLPWARAASPADTGQGRR